MAGFLDDIFKQVASAAAAKAQGYTQIMSSVIGPWAQRFVMNTAPLIEMEMTRYPSRCGTRVGPDPCPAQASLRCIKCRQSHCLAHMFVSYGGEAICFPCAREWIGNDRVGQTGGQPPGPAADPRKVAEVAKAFETLGITATTPFDEAKKAYRELLGKNHPDKARPGRRAAAEARFKEIRAAWDLLSATVYKEAVQ